MHVVAWGRVDYIDIAHPLQPSVAVTALSITDVAYPHLVLHDVSIIVVAYRACRCMGTRLLYIIRILRILYNHMWQQRRLLTLHTHI